MNSYAELDPGRQTPELLRQGVVEAAEANVLSALLATGFTVAAEQQPAVTPVTTVMQEAVEFTPQQNQVGGQNGVALAA